MCHIIAIVIIAAFICLAYSTGRKDEREAQKSVVNIEVSKGGFDYLATVQNGKTITIKNASGDYIMVIPDLKSFQKEDNE